MCVSPDGMDIFFHRPIPIGDEKSWNASSKLSLRAHHCTRPNQQKHPKKHTTRRKEPTPNKHNNGGLQLLLVSI